jgi:uncharacterized protein GlcG (DUF336 family)
VKRFALLCLFSLFVFGQDDPPPDPGAGPGDPAAGTDTAVDSSILSIDDVRTAVQNAATAVNVPLVIAVTDRQGNILAVYRKLGAPALAMGNFSQMVDANELAVAQARTASFFSNNQAPLSTRTVRTISGVHFPPGIMFTPVSDLYGIENTNRGCDFNTTFKPGVNLPRAKSIDGTKPGLGIQTGRANFFDSDATSINTGGVPLFKNGLVVGGIGVVGPTPAIQEFAAAVPAITTPFTVNPAPPGVVIIGGIALPFVLQTTQPPGTSAGSLDGDYLVPPQGSPARAPEGDLIDIHGGTGGLTADDVQKIINQSIAAANSIRGVIRLPLGSRAKMVIAVADLDGTLLGLNRMPDATIFSVDVAVAKSRNVIYFTQNPGTDLPNVPANTAVTNRTISFGSQPFFPPGIDYSQPGPFFELYKFDTLNPCTQGAQPPNPNQSGIVFFPGSTPLYKNGVLVGGLGISGDGVDQDDFVTSGGAEGFQAPNNIRADRIMIRGVRLPYYKFPRNPTQ